MSLTALRIGYPERCKNLHTCRFWRLNWTKSRSAFSVGLALSRQLNQLMPQKSLSASWLGLIGLTCPCTRTQNLNHNLLVSRTLRLWDLGCTEVRQGKTCRIMCLACLGREKSGRLPNMSSFLAWTVLFWANNQLTPVLVTESPQIKLHYSPCCYQTARHM